MKVVRLESVVLALAISIVSFDAVLAQQAPPPWAGWARCQINVTGPGYTDQQTHTWTITGSTPKVEGAFRVYPGTWSVVGGGSLQSTQGTQTRVVQWATNVQGMSGPIAVFVRASDNRMFIQARHAQLRGTASIQGYQQLIIDGKPQWPGRIAAEAFEWSFPVAGVSRPNPDANLIANGSSTPVVDGSVGHMQPAGSRGTATCTWQFAQGSPAPAPPPALPAQAIPTPAGRGVETPPPSGQPAGGATGGAAAAPPAGCLSAPRGLVASVATGTATVTLQWAAPASGVAASYVIQAGTTPGSVNLTNYNTGNALLSIVVPNVPNGSYYVRVHALNSCGLSMPSNEVLLVLPSR